MRFPQPIASTPTRCRGSRRLYLLDPENLATSPLLVGTQAVAVYREVNSAVPIGFRDTVLIGGHHGNAQPCRLMAALTRGSASLKSGRDGAEHALVALLAEIPATEFGPGPHRIAECVIGSGDHFFIGTARQMRSRGVMVTVLSRPHSLSFRLAQAADRVILLGNEPFQSFARAA